MKVLLLGITGNVGSRMLPALLAHNHKVVAFVRSPSKLSPEVTSKLDAVVVGSGTDSASIKAAILSHDCDAIVNAAGLATWNSKSELPDIVAAIVKALKELHEERGGLPIRCWFMSGFGLLDSPVKPYLLLNYLPIYLEHKKNYDLLKSSDIAWSLFCANILVPKYTPPKFPADGSAANLITKADSPPGWTDAFLGVPLIGPYLNLFSQFGTYSTKTEDCVDLIAADLENGLDSEWIGKRIGVKEKPKAA